MSQIIKNTMSVAKPLSDELAGLFTTGFLTDDMVDTIVKVVRKHDAQPNTLQVWSGPMPESNGKTNHTVIIHKGDITEGICVHRSEYSGRAQYEADHWSWLIGDGCEKPWPHHYDTDTHSGYVAPSQAIAWQYRERLKFDKGIKWSPWINCTQGFYDRIREFPELDGFEREGRALKECQ